MNLSRASYYDIAKYAAIVSVIWEHLITKGGLADKSPAFFLICAANMPLFFFISGYFLFQDLGKNRFLSFFMRKTERLLIPYLIWSTVSFLANGMMIVFHAGRDDIYSSLLSEAVSIFLHSRSVWFLIVLYFSQLLFAAVFYLCSYSSSLHFYILLICVYGFTVLIIPNELFSLYKFKWIFPFLILGYFFRSKSIDIAERISLWALLGLPACFLIAKLCNLLYSTDRQIFYQDINSFLNQPLVCISNGISFLLISLSGMLFFLGMAKLLNNSCLSPACSRQGYYSLDVYVIHMLAVHILPVSILGNLPTPVADALLLIAAVIIVWLISVLSHNILSHNQYYRISVGRIHASVSSRTAGPC